MTLLPRQRPLLLVLALLAALLLPDGRALAADVTFGVTNREVFLGGKSFIEVTVRNATSITPPEPPAVDGAEIRRLPGERTSQQTRIVNGVVDTVVTTTFVFEVVPTRTGRIVVPPIEVVADGETFRGEPTTIVVNASETGDLLFVDVVADPPSPMVGEEMTLTLRIWVRPYRNPEANATLGEGDMWQLIDFERSKTGLFKQAFAELEQQRRRPRGEEKLRNDRAYFVYSVQRRVRPSRAGPPEIGPIEIVVNWPTGVRQARNFFGERTVQITGVRPVVATPEALELAVRPLPTEGQPAFFNGAVGRFAVEASAKPNEVAVGDPITLTFTVIAEDDGSTLDGVQAPPFAEIPELARGFRIPSDPIAGSTQGRRKTFTQTFRPTDDAIAEIPAIPFAFFDPQSQRYEIVRTEPIPIEVRPAERLALSQIVGGRVEGGSNGAPIAKLEIVPGGLVANAPIDPSILRNAWAPNSLPIATALLVGPPLAIAALGLVRIVRERRDADPAALRARRAARRARGAIAAASGDPAALLHAITGFVVERLGAPEGSRTRSDALRLLEAHGVDAALRARVDRLLAACERARFAPSTAQPGDASHGEALAALDALDRALPRRPSSAAPSMRLHAEVAA